MSGNGFEEQVELVRAELADIDHTGAFLFVAGTGNDLSAVVGTNPRIGAVSPIALVGMAVAAIAHDNGVHPSAVAHQAAKFATDQDVDGDA